MSLILDALRKSDRQRSRNAAERLRDGPGPAHAHYLPAGLLLVAILLAIVVVLAGWLALDRLPDSRAPETGQAAGAVDNDPAVVTDRAEIRALSAELAWTPPVTADRTPTQGAAPAAGMPVVPEATAELLNAPPLAELPAALRSELPELHVDVHAWAEDPQARFVLINLRRYQEGERLDEGPVLRGILRHGVVLEYRGQLFSLSRQ